MKSLMLTIKGKQHEQRNTKRSAKKKQETKTLHRKTILDTQNAKKNHAAHRNNIGNHARNTPWASRKHRNMHTNNPTRGHTEIQKQYMEAQAIIFHDPLEEHWEAIQKQETIKKEHKYPINREPYTHPNDQNLLIYPERRDRGKPTEQLELRWLDHSPTNQAQINKEKYALRELG